MFCKMMIGKISDVFALSIRLPESPSENRLWIGDALVIPWRESRKLEEKLQTIVLFWLDRKDF